MAYNEITNRNSPNYTKGRGGKKIDKIVIHWWGDPNQNPSTGGIVNWLCNPAAGVSAHFVASGTNREVYQLVNDADTAWHAGDWNANQTSLSIECDPRCRDEDYDVVAELIADLWKYYGKLPLEPHNKFTSTRCPGNYDLNRLKSLAEEKLNPTPLKPVNPHKPVPNAVKLDKPTKYIAKLQKTEVWDLDTNPNYQSVKSLSLGEEFVAYAKIDFNNATYYQTEYAFTKKNKTGVNSNDLVLYVKPEEKPEPVEPPIDYGKENNDLLKQILAIVQAILSKITGVFK